jgi:hypothetical protein
LEKTERSIRNGQSINTDNTTGHKIQNEEDNPETQTTPLGTRYRLKPRASKFRGPPVKVYNILYIMKVGNWEEPHKWNSLGPLFI